MAEYMMQELKWKGTREFRLKPSGKMYKNRRGNMVPEMVGSEFVRTEAGVFELSEWYKKEKEAVLEEMGEEFLKTITDFCSKNCAWLQGKEATENYALECIMCDAWKHWKLKGENK